MWRWCRRERQRQRSERGRWSDLAQGKSNRSGRAGFNVFQGARHAHPFPKSKKAEGGPHRLEPKWRPLAQAMCGVPKSLYATQHLQAAPPSDIGYQCGYHVKSDPCKTCGTSPSMCLCWFGSETFADPQNGSIAMHTNDARRVVFPPLWQD